VNLPIMHKVEFDDAYESQSLSPLYILEEDSRQSSVLEDWNAESCGGLFTMSQHLYESSCEGTSQASQ